MTFFNDRQSFEISELLGTGLEPCSFGSCMLFSKTSSVLFWTKCFQVKRKRTYVNCFLPERRNSRGFPASFRPSSTRETDTDNRLFDDNAIHNTRDFQMDFFSSPHTRKKFAIALRIKNVLFYIAELILVLPSLQIKGLADGRVGDWDRHFCIHAWRRYKREKKLICKWAFFLTPIQWFRADGSGGPRLVTGFCLA